ncbi:redoxin domain-containing protein [bacterium]|nr:redoxin domain-containing protein [bacterium]
MFVVAGCAEKGLADVRVGDAAPAFSLTGIDGKTHALDAYKGKVVVLEWTNPGCPFIVRHAKEKTMPTLAENHPDVVFLAVNSTKADHGDYLEPAEYKKWLDENGDATTTLYDKDGTVGKSYGAKTTPHMFVIDEKGKVIYAGAMDDNASPRKKDGVTNYIDKALAAHKAGKTPDPAQTKAYGCGVKY